MIAPWEGPMARREFACVFQRLRGSGKMVPVGAKGKARPPAAAIRPGFYVKLRVNGRRVWRKAGETKEEAALYVDTLRRELFLAETLGVRPVQGKTFEKFAEEYLEHIDQVHAESTAADERNRIENLVAPYFGTRVVSTITRADVEALLSEKASGVSIATRNRLISLLSAMFRRAVALNLARENPAAGIPRPQEPLRPVGFLDFEQQEQLVEKCAAWLRPVVRLALETGMRQGEILALQWRDVDAQRRVVLVRRAKNGEPREIRLSTRAHDALEAQRLLRGAPHIRGEDRVFAGISEKWSGLAQRTWKAAIAAANLPDMRFHDLRHCAAINFTRAGVPLPDVGKILGHRSLGMVLRYSSHVPADAGDRALEAIEVARAAEASRKEAEAEKARAAKA